MAHNIMWKCYEKVGRPSILELVYNQSISMLILIKMYLVPDSNLYKSINSFIEEEGIPSKTSESSWQLL